MIRRSLLVTTFLAVAISPVKAQPPAPVQAPAGLLRQLWADLESDHLLRREGRSELPRAVTVERRDLNGDGRPEWWVVGTRVCGNANCPRWIYRQHADGRFQQVYDGAGVRIDVLPRRSSGWPALVSVGHMSAYEAVYRRSQWVGGRYVWVDTEYRGRSAAGADSLIYHLAMSNAGGRRRLVLDPVDAGGGLWVSATYDVCANGGLGGGCGAPELVLQSTRLPAGRVCVRFRAEDSEPRYATTSRQGWCGVTTAAPASAGRAGRRLVVQPTRREWAQLGAAYGLAFTGPGMPGRVETDAVGALMAFSWELRDVYSLPCVAEGDCRVTRR